MTITDLRCDRCSAWLSGLMTGARDERTAGIRFSYHPGDPGMRDDSGTLCGSCWQVWASELGMPRSRVCAACGRPVERRASLHLRRLDGPSGWQLCGPHAVELLNALSTVEPKLDPVTFRFPLDRPEGRP
jgi:hypothetical protein